MPSSHVQHPHAANQSQGSIPRSRCRIEFSHEYDTLCSCRTEEWPSIRKVYISRKSSKPVNQRLKLTLFMVQPAILTNPLIFWYTQSWFMFIQLFFCNCPLVHIGFWMIFYQNFAWKLVLHLFEKCEKNWPALVSNYPRIFFWKFRTKLAAGNIHLCRKFSKWAVLITLPMKVTIAKTMTMVMALTMLTLLALTLLMMWLCCK